MTPSRSCSVPVSRRKRSRIDDAVTMSQKDSLSSLRDIVNDPSIPAYVKLMVDLLLETKEEVKQVNQKNGELMDELLKLREENSRLKQQLSAFQSPPTLSLTQASRVDFSCNTDSFQLAASYEERERTRSIVISGLPESQSHTAFNRIVHDFSSTQHILDFLNVDCLPTTVYRMGKPNPSRPRLLKVILPCSRFQKTVLKLAPRLRFFSQKGIYIRPSLTFEERKLRREEHLRMTGRLPERPIQITNSPRSIDQTCNSPSGVVNGSSGNQ